MLLLDVSKQIFHDYSLGMLGRSFWVCEMTGPNIHKAFMDQAFVFISVVE